jgi:RNA polymerase sigma-70 factor (ECF subfamily)
VRECIDQFGGLIWSIARRMTRDRADAENAVQEIFADLWRTADRFDPEQGSPEVFVALIARRRLLDRMRHAAQRGRVQSNKKIESRGWADASNAVCSEARAAGQAVKMLRPELRRVLQLGLLEGMSHAEIADALQLPLDTVKAMMSRGLIQARELAGK